MVCDLMVLSSYSHSASVTPFVHVYEITVQTYKKEKACVMLMQRFFYHSLTLIPPEPASVEERKAKNFNFCVNKIMQVNVPRSQL